MECNSNVMAKGKGRIESLGQWMPGPVREPKYLANSLFPPRARARDCTGKLDFDQNLNSEASQ